MSQSRRQFLQGSLALAGLSLLSSCGIPFAPAAQRPRLRRIGFLETQPIIPRIQPFREGMRELGYADGEGRSPSGQNLLIEYRSTDGNPDLLPALAAELVGLPVELIVAVNPAAARAAAQATSVTPIVVAGGNLVAAGLVTNVAHPEGNITGVTNGGAATISKWIELLKESVPTLSRLAVLWDPGAIISGAAWRLEVARAAQTLLLQPTWYDLPDLDQLSAVLAMVEADGVDGLVLVSGGVIAGGQDPRIGAALLKSQLPAVGESREFVVNGGLLGHVADSTALARRAATYVDKILKGAQPGDLPIELPTKFSIAVNLKTAQALGLTIPQSVLQQATEIIQ